MDQTKKMHRPTNPRKGANICSILTFAYIIPTFIKHYFNEMEENDVPHILSDHSSSKLGDKLEKVWNIERDGGRKSLWLSLNRVFGVEFGILGIVLAVDELFLKLIRPLAVAYVLRYFVTENENKKNKDELLMCAGIIVGVSLLSSIIFHFAGFALQVLGMKIRVACCSLIYRKSLLLSKSALATTTFGQITTLLLSDVQRIDSAVFTAHSIWQVPVQIVLVVGIMYQMLGLMSIVGILFMLLIVPLQVFLGSMLSKLRLKTASHTDARVRLMNEILYGIKVIKMYTWEKSFETLVMDKRRVEMANVRSANYIRGVMKGAVYGPKLAIFLTIVTYVVTGNNLTAVYVFTVTCFYDTLKNSLCITFSKAIADLAEIRVSLNRIKKFLLYDEQDIGEQKGSEKVEIELKGVTASWCFNSSQATIQDITLQIKSNEHVAIVGPVGCGKSSILELILKELPIQKGAISVHGQISYASQEPWLFSGSIQQNILFGKQMNSIRYKNVLQACALERDLELLPYGDQTLVGERGVILSGGQKARVNLARAIYKDVDIYLLDDPFAAVDAHVGLHIFNNCIKNLLSNKCVVLVTHQLQYLDTFNKIVLIESGAISVAGSINDILEHPSEFTNLLKNSNHDQVASYEHNTNKVPNTNEKKDIAAVKTELYTNNAIGKTLRCYIKAGGSTTTFVLVMLAITLSQLSIAGVEYFIVYWINHHKNLNDGEYWQSVNILLYGYSSTAAIMVGTLILQGYAFFTFCTNAAIKLHNNMFSGIINTSLSFFNLNTSGKVINRFSKDVCVIDEQIPMTAIETIQIGFRLVLGICLICISNVWLLIHSIVFIISIYLVRMIYFPTNQKIKFFEATARGPVVGHLNETLQGISTVRAFGAQHILRTEFDTHQNFHSSMWYLFLSSTRALIFYIDIVCVVYIAAITFTLVLFPIDQYAGNIGLAITQGIIMLSSQQWGMLQSSELENSMVSVERVQNYAQLEPEDPKEHPEPPTSWPEEGMINFSSCFLRYSETGPSILKDLTFSIQPKEKIGVVGRTGAGKSSLVAALFQLVRTQGLITIDNINVSDISLHNLRSKISIIPQEPMLFSGTLRRNLDPFNLSSDEELWMSLEEVELKAVVAKFPFGLDYIVAEGGSNFSVGQRQLICLARAILRKNRILILDEATANVDPYTDTLIQSTLRRKFEHCTVFTIAHRLNTIMDCDRILVMVDGTLIEFDHPYSLLKKENGVFHSMVQQMGNEKAKLLTQVAENSFMKSAIHRTSEPS